MWSIGQGSGVYTRRSRVQIPSPSLVYPVSQFSVDGIPIPEKMMHTVSSLIKGLKDKENRIVISNENDLPVDRGTLDWETNAVSRPSRLVENLSLLSKKLWETNTKVAEAICSRVLGINGQRWPNLRLFSVEISDEPEISKWLGCTAHILTYSATSMPL